MKVRNFITLPMTASVIAICLGGCADLMQRSVVAPDWFEAKAGEVKGEGYPDLHDVPEADEIGSLESWDAEAREVEQKALEVEMSTTIGNARPTPEESRARAAQLRARVDD